ncbi:TMAO reductase system sensor histidine kinase/response regulator TorS [Ferrimonas balearica]|uniref:TMAO reductase system sensor histidine kinase/response regulator TorS n=1 Tax=Ferrimonas balearica TaxID=44012 RepID=UPI001C98F9D1|nr:TMAO reductase system sensor histidine kinase/response regulator TorS [Ferrimonas balearica]MBY5993932.1 TMAO reductase system sensor histidine kinase/response regulator TorS [Ferrimonas balearica]
MTSLRFSPWRSVAGKLLIAFVILASLSVLAAVLGWISLSQLRASHQQLTEQAVPALNQSRAIAELSGRTLNGGRLMAEIPSPRTLDQTWQTLEATNAALDKQLDQLLGMEPGQRTTLKQLHREVRAILTRMHTLAQAQLADQQAFDDRFARVNEAANALADLADGQLANAETVLVARSLGLYDSPNRAAQVDGLVEQDLMQIRRMNELKSTLLRLRRTLVLLPYLSNPQPMTEQGRQFAQLAEYLPLQLAWVADPERRAAMENHAAVLRQGGTLFHARHELSRQSTQMSAALTQLVERFEAMNETVLGLVVRANAGLSDAQQQIERDYQWALWGLLLLGLVAALVAGFVLWRVVYREVVVRLNGTTQALLRLAEGDRDVPIIRGGSDELSRLAGAIDTFKATALAREQAEQALRAQHQRLEQAVTERTDALNRANGRLAKQLEATAEAKAQAEAASRAKTTFLATMSHEIRTPMNGILGTAELMADANLSPQQDHYLGVIRRSGEALLDVLNDVLDYSKIEAGHLNPLTEPVEVGRLAQAVVDTLASRAAQKRLTLRVEQRSALAAAYLGDGGKLRQVLLNLVGNAIKFTERGEVVLAVWEQDGALTLAVEDTGMGIEPARQRSVFEPFQQSRSGEQWGGTGLGLPISRRLVEAMGGALTLDSTPGQGSAFEVTLPWPHTEAVQAPQPRPQALPSATVLVVEDNAVNRMVMAGFLGKLGQRVVMADSGAAARAQAAAQAFDLALVDIRLPDGDGVELQGQLKALQQSHFGRALPCIAVSAQVFEEQVRDYLAAGFEGFVAKPVRLSRLADALAGQLGNGEPEGAMEVPKVARGVDWAQLAQDRSVLGQALIQTMVSRFESEAQATLAAMATASEGEALAALAHKLKGGASALGLVALGELCQQIEQGGQWSPIGSEALAQQLAEDLARLRQWLAEPDPTGE